jgi:hypothetical protein
MTRIGILGINDLTETFLVELFRRDPHAHVFLSAEDNERANLLARKFPAGFRTMFSLSWMKPILFLYHMRTSGQKILSISKHSWFFY